MTTPRTAFRAGEKHPDAKLTDDKVREIRRLYRAAPPFGFPPANAHSLARAFGVSHVTVWKIVNDMAWRHVR